MISLSHFFHQEVALMLNRPLKSSKFGAILWLISSHLHHEILMQQNIDPAMEGPVRLKSEI